MNKIVAIGFPSSFRCYVNVDRAEAIRRFDTTHSVEEGYPPNYHESMIINEFEFGDEFEAYSVEPIHEDFRC